MSRWHLLLLDELDVLEDHVLSDLGSQVDELHIVVEPVEGLDPMAADASPPTPRRFSPALSQRCLFLLEVDLEPKSPFIWG